MNFPQQIKKKIASMKFHEIRPPGTELFQADARADGQTDMTKIIVAFRNLSNAPKNRGIVLVWYGVMAQRANF